MLDNINRVDGFSVQTPPFMSQNNNKPDLLNGYFNDADNWVEYEKPKTNDKTDFVNYNSTPTNNMGNLMIGNNNSVNKSTDFINDQKLNMGQLLPPGKIDRKSKLLDPLQIQPIGKMDIWMGENAKVGEERIVLGFKEPKKPNYLIVAAIIAVVYLVFKK
jgi:hypothetical protein